MSKEEGEEAVNTSSANPYHEERSNNNNIVVSATTTTTSNVVSEIVMEQVNFTDAINIPILKKKSRSTSCLPLQKHSSRDKTGLKDGRRRHFSCQNGENCSNSFSSSKISSSTTTTATSTTTISSFSSTSSLENEISKFNNDQNNEDQLSSPKKRNRQSRSSASQVENTHNDDDNEDMDQSQKKWETEISGITLLDFPWDDIHFIYTLPLLSWKDLFNLRAASVRSCALVGAYFSKLKVLDVSRVHPPFSSIPFRLVTENCTNLRKLILEDSDWIQDQDLTRIFRENRFLVHVDLSGCSKLNGSCLLSLSVNCKLLTTLILRDCTWVSRGAVETLMAHLRRLQVVDFTACAQLNNHQFSPFTKAFPQLKRLHLARIQSVNDSTLTIIARNCKNMLHLDIRACMGVTDNGIRMIAEYCTNLQSLYIVNCHLVTEYSLSILRARGSVSIDRPCSFVMPMYVPRIQV